MVAGRQFWLWRAVDDEGEVLDLLVQRRRDKAAAVKLMRKLLKKQGFAPEVLVTDKLRSYGAAKSEIRLSARHEQGLRKNNRAEFAPADTTARAQDATLQIARISPALLVHSRRRPKHFQRPAPSHIPPHAPRLSRGSLPGLGELLQRPEREFGLPIFMRSNSVRVTTPAFDQVDWISLHTYLNNWKDNTPALLASADLIDGFIEGVIAVADATAARRRSSKRIMLSFDEWNVWYRTRRPFEYRVQRGWPVAPPILEEVYSVEDALAVGGVLISFLNHADRVRCARLAQLVNVIAPITTQIGGPAWRQTGFVRVTAGRPRVARHFRHHVAFKRRERATRPTPRLAFVCKPGE